ncbi:PilZ domain-containing protein [Stappia indica]|uniref:PilZ domain-containing protein n=1 Tax=Stappia indica TaxID=538381 RepID=A0A285S7P0_9HYPH|nr:PilZ domain-containing protein [Stappia indica]SOC03559.1 PilZ domain-containing protein [Stappia indica]
MRHKPTVRGEIRSAPRANCTIPAIIVDRGISISCIVEDLSITGCRVRMKGQAALSRRFVFEFPKRAIKVEAELVWMNGDEAGIRFLHKKTGEDKPAASTAASSTGDQVEIG